MSRKKFFVAFNRLNEPINLGGPSIMEVVKEWVISNPDGTKEECAVETGVSLDVLNKFWILFVVTSDISLEYVSQSRDCLIELTKSWIRHFPKRARSLCYKDICIPRNFWPYIKEHWEEYGGTLTTRMEKAEEIVKSWIKENPNGSFYECCRDTGLQFLYVNPYWPEHMNRGGYQDYADKERIEKISTWIKENPDRTLTECRKELHYMKQVVDRLWTVSGGKEENRCTIKEKNIRILSAWIASGKSGGIAQCLKDTGLSYAVIRNNWAKAGGSELGPKAEERLKKEEKVKKWMDAHPDGTEKECKEATNVAIYIVRKCWIKFGGKRQQTTILKDAKNDATIKEWIQNHPNGTIKQCSEETGLSCVTIRTYWNYPSDAQKEQLKQESPRIEDVSSEEMKIKNWLEAHPNGTRRECRAETGVSKNNIQKYWKIYGGKNERIVKREKEKQTVIEWLQANPDKTYPECSRAIGIPVSCIWVFVREAGCKKGDQTPAKIAKLKEWVKNNPLGTKKECHRATMLAISFIQKHWKECEGFAGTQADNILQRALPELKKWWDGHPDGTMAQCHRETGIRLTTIRRYLEEQKKNNE